VKACGHALVSLLMKLFPRSIKQRATTDAAVGH
jgi:hypothetical protein